MVDLKKLSRIDEPAPGNDKPLEQIKRFVKDLAEGALKGLWSPRLNYRDGVDRIGFDGNRHQVWKPGIPNEDITSYVENIWWKQNIDEPQVPVLQAMGYFTQEQEYASDHLRCFLTEKAFDLLKEEPLKIFISYCRDASSALALLVWSEMEKEGYDTFIDFHGIHLGDPWSEVIKKRIDECELFIVIIGKATLKSEAVQNEITQAWSSRKRIISILHQGISERNLKKEPFSSLKGIQFLNARSEVSTELYSIVETLKVKVR